MSERARIFAVTGNDVVAFALAGEDSHAVLGGVGARCVAADPRDPDRVYVGAFDDGVFASDDGGATWRQDERGLADRRVMSVAVSPSDQEGGISVVYAGTEPSNLYRSEDGGHSWQRLPALRELPSEPSWSFPPRPSTHHVRTIALHPTDPDWLAVGIELGGVMRSGDAGASCLTQPTGLQRRTPAADPPARAPTPVRGRRRGGRTLAGPRRELAPARRRP